MSVQKIRSTCTFAQRHGSLQKIVYNQSILFSDVKCFKNFRTVISYCYYFVRLKKVVVIWQGVTK
jgi:hypothetical protein